MPRGDHDVEARDGLEEVVQDSRIKEPDPLSASTAVTEHYYTNVHPNNFIKMLNMLLNAVVYTLFAVAPAPAHSAALATTSLGVGVTA